jgi:hypothetical protein
MFDPDIKDTINQLTLRPVKSAESLTALQKQESEAHFEVRLKPLSGELDDIAPLEAVTEAVGRKQDASMKGHERSSSHDSYFKHKFTPRHSTEDAESSGEAPTKQVPHNNSILYMSKLRSRQPENLKTLTKYYLNSQQASNLKSMHQFWSH